MACMRIVVPMALALLVCAPVPGRSQSNEGGMAGDVKSEKVVRESFDRFVAAWNRHDVEALGNMYAVDGDHIEPDGNHVDGRAAVTMLYKRQHESVFKQTRLMLNIADVWFITEDVALVDGGYAISGIRTPEGTEVPERRGHLTSILLREGGTWAIAASRLMIPTELPYKK